MRWLSRRIAARRNPERRRLLERARTAGAARRFREAALLYEEVLRSAPDDARVRIQCGHMRKEAGDLPAAEEHYLAALARLPDDADLAVQLGHFLKLQNRLDKAEAHYARALALDPGSDDAARELRALQRKRRVGQELGPPLSAGSPADGALEAARAIGRLSPRLAPRAAEDRPGPEDERLVIGRLGRSRIGAWGVRRTLQGIEAVRGYAISTEPIVGVEVVIDGLVVERGVPSGPHPVRTGSDPSLRKYVFNLWVDFGDFPFGLHGIELRLDCADGSIRSFRDEVVIDAPPIEADFPDSDALVALDRGAAGSIEERIRIRPSMVRDANRSLLLAPPKAILVLRTDQLGDLIASIPALRRLRAIAPGARIVGLFTAANADLARTLDMLDEVIEIDFPDDPVERRRIMPLEAQEALRRRLAPYAFDIALDLAQSDVSRDLLPLSGARLLYGVAGDFPYLSAEFQLNSHDRWSGRDIIPHSTKVSAMVEALGVALAGGMPVIQRPELRRAMLEPYGIGRDDRYAVLHLGARIAFSRWPHFDALAALLLAETDLTLVVMGEDRTGQPPLPEALRTSGRVIRFDHQLPFDIFDAFVSFATVLVGNDSGPKHLAALRGTNVVTLFTARIDWREWGQEGVGTIISRKVPCQGCGIFHDAEECGKGFACIVDIRPREVADAVLRYVDPVENTPPARPTAIGSP